MDEHRSYGNLLRTSFVSINSELTEGTAESIPDTIYISAPTRDSAPLGRSEGSHVKKCSPTFRVPLKADDAISSLPPTVPGRKNKFAHIQSSGYGGTRRSSDGILRSSFGSYCSDKSSPESGASGMSNAPESKKPSPTFHIPLKANVLSSSGMPSSSPSEFSPTKHKPLSSTAADAKLEESRQRRAADLQMRYEDALSKVQEGERRLNKLQKGKLTKSEYYALVNASSDADELDLQVRYGEALMKLQDAEKRLTYLEKENARLTSIIHTELYIQESTQNNKHSYYYYQKKVSSFVNENSGMLSFALTVFCIFFFLLDNSALFFT